MSYTEGDVNHAVQPVIGQMRLLASRGKEYGGTAVTVSIRELDYWIAQLYKACAAEDAWLAELQDDVQIATGLNDV